MASPISTTGTSPTVSTSHQPPETVRQWVERHSEAVLATTPGSKLETDWVSNNGAQNTSTTRLPGESDADFLQRHIQAYLLAMLDEPPKI